MSRSEKAFIVYSIEWYQLALQRVYEQSIVPDLLSTTGTQERLFGSNDSYETRTGVLRGNFIKWMILKVIPTFGNIYLYLSANICLSKSAIKFATIYTKKSLYTWPNLCRAPVLIDSKNVSKTHLKQFYSVITDFKWGKKKKNTKRRGKVEQDFINIILVKLGVANGEDMYQTEKDPPFSTPP